MGHIPVESKEDYQKALESNPGKYVLFYMYEGEVSQQATEYSDKFQATTTSYKVDVSKFVGAKKGANVTQVPTILIFKDSQEVHRAEPKDVESMKKIGDIVAS